MKRSVSHRLVACLLLFLTGCETVSQPQTQVQGATVVGTTTPPSIVPPTYPSYRPAGAVDETVPTGTRAQVVRGTGSFIGATPTPPGVGAEGDVSLNFTNADVRDVAKAVLGDILGLTYAVDPMVEGQVTIETSRPIRRDQVLATFEVALQAAQLGLVRDGNLYTVIPVSEGVRQSGLVGASEAGFGTEAVPLRYVSGAELKRLLDPLVPTGAIVQVDEARNILFVTGSSNERRNLRDLAAQFDVDWLRGVSFALIVPQWTDSRNLVEQLTQLLNAEGVPTAGTIRFVPIQQVNGILAISTRASYLDRVRSLVEMLDREAQGSRRRLFVYRVQNGRAADLAKVLAAAFGAEGGRGGSSDGTPATPSAGLATGSSDAIITPGSDTDGSLPAPPTIDGQASSTPASMTIELGEAEGAIKISADETTNSIVVFAKPQQYEIVADALRRLDILPLQVMIESAVTEVTLNEELRYGVQWFFQTGNSSFSLSEAASGLASQIFPGFSYLLTNNDSITAVLNALDKVTDINVVSAPKLLVLNNQTASLQVGDQVPVATQSAVSTDNPDSPIVNSIEYRDTGVILKITPRVNDNGVVLLDVSQEVSNVIETDTSQLDSPTIQQRRIATSVAVQDGQTIALGGLITEDRQNGESGIPVLKDIPLFGPLFGTTSRRRERTELLVLLTPRVVRNAADAKRITDELREKIRGVEPLPVEKEPTP